uniref:Uncharacterized protein n=1 Tax=Craspedostauros australis TaxID=1486917 RepID=A0A7R9WP34_9STRA|mmetsp:Transcript_11824/g.32563  ORF Transcript_11824/g.32563 Transcript_11824/m.32563 type:complete len:390 (+) Transcript_11824:127-1296(+)
MVELASGSVVDSSGCHSFLLDPSLSEMREGARIHACSDGIRQDIAFLRQKQSIFGRIAKFKINEEAFKASTALKMASKGDHKEIESPIWKEAREVIEVLNRQKEPKQAGQQKRKNSMPAARANHATRAGILGAGSFPFAGEADRKRFKIDNSSVLHLLSNSRDNRGRNNAKMSKKTKTGRIQVSANSGNPSGVPTSTTRTLPVLNQVPKSLLHHHHIENFSVETVLAGILRDACAGESIPMSNAMSLSNFPKLIVTANAPFLIIYMNKAFLKAHGPNDSNMLGLSMLRQPVASMLQDAMDRARHGLKGGPFRNSDMWKSLLRTDSDVDVRILPILDPLSSANNRIANLLLEFYPTAGSRSYPNGGTVANMSTSKPATLLKHNQIIEMVG